MAAGDLTSLANVRDWLSVANTNSDGTIARLITAASGQIRVYCGRYSFLPQSIVETRDGTGGRRFVLKNWPVLSVSAVSVGPVSIPAAVVQPTGGLSCGWSLSPYDGNPPGDPQFVELDGWDFCHGSQNVSVTYRFGYQAAEATTVSADEYAVGALQGAWSADGGVTYAGSGAALRAVQASPQAGQYLVSGGVYRFSAADAGQPVVVTYGFVPYDLEQACIDLVAHKFRGRDRIGLRSQSLAGQQTSSYDISGMPDSVVAALQPYKSVLLVP
jgi:hypothetical protein